MTAAIRPIKPYKENNSMSIVKDITENYGTGHVKIYRSLKNHWLWKASRKKSKLEAWLDLLMLAVYIDSKEPFGHDLIQLKRGQALTSQESLAKEWLWDRSSVRSFLHQLESDGMIQVRSTSKYTVITICNYASYHTSKPSVQQVFNSNPTSSQHIQEVQEFKEDIDTTIPTDHSFVPDGTTKPKDEVQTYWGENYKHLSTNKEQLKQFLQTKKPAFINPYVTYWNLVAEQKGWPKIKELTEARKKKLKTRLAEKSFDFTTIIDHAEQSNVEKKEGGVWFSFDWMMESQTNYVKMIEGNYKAKTTTTNNQTKNEIDAKLAERQKTIEANRAKFGQA